LVEILLAFALKEDLERFAVFFVEIERRGDVEVMLETGDMDEDGMTSL
jgi:Ni,Fe-hydrogenase III small subunit